MICIAKSRRPLVCMFDSGIGGLNLLYACRRRLPGADYYYLADNYFVPYGNLAEEEVRRRVFRFFKEISALRPDAAVVACNTVTAECIADLRAVFPFPIIGVEPAVKQAAKLGGKFLVLATEATCKSNSFLRLISAYGGEAEVYPLKGLAREIENNIFSLDAEALASGLPGGDYRSVVLGCTHYIFIAKSIQKRYSAQVFDGMAGTADHLVTILGNFDHFSKERGKIAFFCGDFAKNRAIFEKLEHNDF